MASLINVEELEIYKRQLLIKGFTIEVQQKLKKATVLIAGVGGLGSIVSLCLAGAGIGRLVLVDHDVINVSDLNRQFLFSYSDVGKPKVEVACRRLKSLNPFIKAIGLKLTIDERSMERVIDDFKVDVVIDCLDNIESRMILNKVVVKKEIPMVHGGVRGLKGEIMVIVPRKTPCLQCLLPQLTKGEKRREIPVIGPIVTIIGGLEALEAIKIISGVGSPLLNKLLRIDGRVLNVKVYGIARNPNCPVCASV
ncbi:MAG: hypothetical protein DRN15_03705 [Thermoprotei archaeon]|nr:MAG: hypothetical protein DRM97_04665 [Thermoprotei archaeon]RLF24231.1 MAG: hypothetical protein DRN15_03705 [Thermoprotei archaeon]